MPSVPVCLALVTLGAAVVVVSAQIAVRGVTAGEETLFRRANGSPDGWFPFVFVPMQFGTYITTPAIAGFLWVSGRHPGAVAVLATGTLAWVGAKVVKRIAGRGRPAHALAGEVVLRGPAEGGTGYPSGHAATSTSLAVVLGVALGGWWWPVLIALVLVTGFGRMYVGVHLPWDIVGGVGVGLVVAGIVMLAWLGLG
jgi:undecaprenyl-diphosphatase